MVRKKKLAVLLTAVSAMVSVCGLSMSTSAAWRSVSDTYNYVSTPTFSLGIVESYSPPEAGISPGVDVEKTVAVENTGSISALVRVRLDKEMEGVDPEQISLNTNDEDWFYDTAGDWYYYKESLYPGEITEPVLYSFSLDDNTGNEYQNTDGAVTVTAESLQNSADALEDTWGVTYEQLAMEAPESWSSGVTTSVTFLSPERAFDIDQSKQDLFANFKDLIPGEKRSQDVSFRNSYDEQVSMYLTCMEDGEALTEGSSLYELLHEYVTITITSTDGNIVYEGPVAGEGQCDIPLGAFVPGEEKKLTVALSVSPDMTTEQAGLLGSVRWEVAANSVDAETIVPIVQTSDPDLFVPGLLLMCAGLAGVIIGLLPKKKKGGISL